ncbi:MAG: 30S ribosomal protein S17e [Candidatus Verstraetearchaeota archaeon]|jgi:small subunit ribosomal protein S17e|uniref:Small ribosomal subunit protein eS17 n=1 Tax=Thermoproteota archaeon TaxID=2056631 RepID=A0A523BF98_9CREN|nr:30S ribosomal protein S17e [Candidatus Verstraetearchaeota archaeon]TDA39617.1 MAG: 30S ribosomal protein S17e [Candidatus Verstraetearchaeota archaeon]
MGKVRIGKVKAIAVELTERYPNVFTTDFETNKKLVYQYSDIRSKHLGNRVAGYITRLLVSKKKREEAIAAEEAELAKMAGSEDKAPEAPSEPAPQETGSTEGAAAGTEKTTE